MLDENIKNKSALAGLGAFVIAMAVYAVTLAPSLPCGHDSCELTTACAVNGIPHPPGYPLYTVMGAVLCWLSPFDASFTVNLYSGLAGAFACGLAGFAFSIFANSPLAGFAAGLFFGFSLSPWRMAVGAEVFSLHLFFCALIFALLPLWRMADQNQRPKYLNLLLLSLGLSLAHHQTIVLILPGVFLYMKYSKDGKQYGISPNSAIFLALGLLPYAWLFIRASQNPPLNWGDPSSISGFFWTIFRLGYGGLALSTSSGQEPNIIWHLTMWLKNLISVQFYGMAVALGFVGMIVGWRNKKAEFWLFLGLFICSGPLWSIIANSPEGDGFFDMLLRFYAASNLGFAGFVSLGLAMLIDCIYLFFSPKDEDYLPKSGDKKSTSNQGAIIKQLSFVVKSYNTWAYSEERRAFLKSRDAFRLEIVVATVVVFLVANSIFTNFDLASEKDNYIVPFTKVGMLHNIPDSSLVVTVSDLPSGVLFYSVLVENRSLLHVPMGVAASPWFVRSLPENAAKATALGGLPYLMEYYRTLNIPVYTENVIPGVKGFFVPEGLMFRYLAPQEKIPLQDSASKKSIHVLEEAIKEYSEDNDKDLPLTFVRGKSRPFWHIFLLKKWRSAYTIAKDGIKDQNCDEYKVAKRRIDTINKTLGKYNQR